MDNPVTDFQIILQKIEFLSNRVNSGIKLILIINGDLTVETNSRYYRLEEKDLMVINRNQLYQIRGSENNCVLMLNISDAFINQYYADYRNHRFECYSREVDIGRESMINSIRKLLAELVITYFRKDESYQIEIQGYICQILLILIRRFKYEGLTFEKVNMGDLRITQIMEYIEKNYDEMISLEDIAHKFYLSTGYLSRYFKQKLGVGFSQYLMNIRLKHSMKDLLYTSRSISQISMDNGFPNTKSFTDLFKKLYGETPRTYREKHIMQKVDVVQNYSLEDTATPITSPEILLKLGMLLMNDDGAYSNTKTYFEELVLDLHQSMATKLNHPNHLLIIGDLERLLREDVKSQVLTVKDELGLQYIGIMHLMSGTIISPIVETDERITTSSPYFKLDLTLNFLLKNNLSLFVEVDYTEISNDETKYFNNLSEFLKHCIQVYGESFLSSWYFMFHESYFTATQEAELKRVYLKLYQSLKRNVSGISIGAFLPFSIDNGKISDNHAWLIKESKYIDFFGYNANQNEGIDFKSMENEPFFLAKDYIKEKTNQVKAYLKQKQIDKPLHLVAWNTLSGVTRYTNGVFFRGALVLKNALDVANEVQSLGFWINTELHEEEKNSQLIQIEGLELFHYFCGKRPVYYAMLFFKRLRGEVIAQGSEFIMTKNELGYQLVLMNCNNVNPYFSLEETFLQKLNKDIRVTITGLQSGEYQIRKLIFDKDHGALYTKWFKLNSKYGLDSEVINYIIRSSHPSMEIFDESLNGDWSFYSYLSVNAIHFFDIRRALV